MFLYPRETVSASCALCCSVFSVFIRCAQVTVMVDAKRHSGAGHDATEHVKDKITYTRMQA